MLPIYRKDLLLLSRILLSRLTRPNTVEINIIQDHLLESGQDRDINIERTFGRFVGCFYWCRDSICFYLAARSSPDEKISHLFVYYLNLGYKSIQEEDMTILSSYIPELKKPDHGIKLGVVDVICHSSGYSYLNLFLEAIEYTLGSHLIKQFKCSHTIEVETQDLSINPFASQYTINCNGILLQSSIEAFRDVADYYGVKFMISLNGEKLNNPEFALVKFRGHFIGIIFHRESRIVNCVTVHRDQLDDQESYDSFTRLVDSFYDIPIISHPITRLHYKCLAECDDKLFRYGLSLALTFAPHVFVGLKTNEMLYIIENRSPGQSSVETEANRRSSKKPSSRPSSCDSSVSTQVRSQYYTKLRVYNDGRGPEILSDVVNSQATEVVPHNDMRVEISFWREISKERQRIRDIIVPPVHKIDPISDFTQSYLKFMPCYYEAVQFMSELWSRYANTIVINAPRQAFEVTTDVQFIIYTSKTLSEEKDYLMIVDIINKEWIYLQLGNDPHKDPTKFEAITRRFRTIYFPEYANFIGRAVPIINGNCHEEYPRLHLLMSLYVMFRLFGYSIQLPQKVIFGEWELRKYASNICTQLQIANSEYNIDHNLVDSNGYLSEGAMQSLPSPLRLETGVVSKDQCMFCKRRGFNNLGRHMSMQHGGQAHLARSSRS